ncbi:hypothetical protein NQZ68_032163 [Dissostichus eleginoides]|nr:hypothetical protein NQZ68_032163 [Dissostichus eleginoides]
MPGVCSGKLLLAKGLFVVRGVVVDAVTPLRVPPPPPLLPVALCCSPARLMLISRRNDPVTVCRAQGRGAAQKQRVGLQMDACLAG